jgi:Reverse transcriptase (RNA-dependent DNA polymerase)
VVYLDNIMIFSKTWKEHIEHLKKVLEILRKEKFLVKKKKCTFGKEEVGYLGFIVEKRQVKTDLGKVEEVNRWPVSQNQKEVKEFLGLVNYFMHQYAHMTAPLNELLKKRRSWK